MADSIPDLEQLVADLNQNNFPPHIAGLSVKDKLKRAFALYERCGVTQPWGLTPSLPKELRAVWKRLEFGKRHAFNRILMTRIWWGFFFGPFYYFFAGLWRKGIVLFCGLMVFSIVLDVLFMAITGMEEMPRAANTGIGVAVGILVSMMATYDLYRLKVKKQTFWW